MSDGQREVFKEDELISALKEEEPKIAGLQRNGCCAAFFKRKKEYFKIIFAIKHQRVDIITFMITEQIPNLKKLK